MEPRLAFIGPGIDGNKRVSALAAIAFIRVNGFTIEVDENEFAELVLRVASGACDKSSVAAFFRKHIRPIDA